jgi:Protein of unknown function (DUF4239)
MILWIESQDAAVIALLVFVLCYAIAGAIFFVATMISRHRTAADLKMLTPVLLTPLSVIAGLLIAFLASRVWANVDRANAYVAQEANAISEIVLLLDALPEVTRGEVRAGLQQHLRFIEAEDWPAMLAGQASLSHASPGLTETMTALLAFNATDSSQRIAQERSVGSLERALEARQGRILLSSAVIAPAQWLVIFGLDALVLATLGMVHIDRRVTTAAGMLIFSTAVAACLVLLMINDRPFSAGGFSVQPTALRQIRLE